MKARNDRVVLITGASSGIGKACADHLAKGGYRVYGTSRKPPSVAPFRMMQLDVTDDESVEGTVNELLKREGRIDVLVNNAGIAMAGAIEDTSVEEARTQLETNFFGAFRMCWVVVPTMRAQKYGYIVTISSIGGQIAIPFQGLYSASKFALEGLSESLRMEVRPFGIKVILIQPGDHRTALTQRHWKRGSSDVYAFSPTSLCSVARTRTRQLGFAQGHH